ncbi:hypothetical protein PoB_003955600 [Plakobranchus ocellatus]|uniref:Uncharacterized protein n=1 Tax=Plakobranchus ocellatus TaxID=259542 RepID=A0AAV4B2I4_9GAST|nr:hypothetical protein PoB_003955600 [Plakobranchus ocellatus]
MLPSNSGQGSGLEVLPPPPPSSSSSGKEHSLSARAHLSNCWARLHYYFTDRNTSSFGVAVDAFVVVVVVVVVVLCLRLLPKQEERIFRQLIPFTCEVFTSVNLPATRVPAHYIRFQITVTNFQTIDNFYLVSSAVNVLLTDIMSRAKQQQCQRASVAPYRVYKSPHPIAAGSESWRPHSPRLQNTGQCTEAAPTTRKGKQTYQAFFKFFFAQLLVLLRQDLCSYSLYEYYGAATTEKTVVGNS